MAIYDYSAFLAQVIEKGAPQGSFTCTTLSRTRLLLDLTSNGKTEKFRILAFAIGGTGRGRGNERRLEITSTYERALKPEPGVTDIVIGVERDHGLLVGIDSDRLNFGGPTSNASTFVYSDGFEALKSKSHDVRLVPSNLIQDEKQTYMRPAFLLDYVRGARGYHKLAISTENKRMPSDTIPEKPGVKLSFDEQMQLALRKMQIGKLGEQLVLSREVKRLKVTNPTMASKVQWVSQTHPYRGYDIASFEANSSPLYVEVKASSGQLSSFHFTENEFRVADHYKASYHVICVSEVTSAKPIFHTIKDPATQINAGALKTTRDGLIVWR